MKPILVLMTAGSAALADPLLQADLAKLRDVATGDAEASRLADCKGSVKLTGYRLLTAGQKEGKPSLHVLCSRREYQSKRFVWGGEYEIEKPEEIFGKEEAVVSRKFVPDLEVVADSVVQVFDSTGKETRPFGGNNYVSRGHLFDFDGDGILDLAESAILSVDSVEVFRLQTVELTPRVLLEVAYNWHPASASDANDWTFTCQDEDKDGLVEIAFGPESATPGNGKSRIVFRLDPVTRRYTAGDVAPDSHVRVMKPDGGLTFVSEAVLKMTSNTCLSVLFCQARGEAWHARLSLQPDRFGVEDPASLVAQRTRYPAGKAAATLPP